MHNCITKRILQLSADKQHEEKMAHRSVTGYTVRVAECFFVPIDGKWSSKKSKAEDRSFLANEFRCKHCGKTAKQDQISGVGNLMTHCKSKQCFGNDSFFDEFDKLNPPSKGQLKLTDKAFTNDNGFSSAKAKNLFGWLDLVTECNMPIESCHNAKLLPYMNLEPVDPETLWKYMDAVSKVIVKKISDEIETAKSVAVVSDGWSQGGEHYLGLYASYAHPEGKKDIKDRTIAKYAFLGMAPPGDGESYSAEVMKEYTLECCDYYRLTKPDRFGEKLLDEKVKVMVSDNTAVNPATARALGIEFIGCSSHKFELAMSKLLEEHEQLLQKVHELMKKVKGSLVLSAIGLGTQRVGIVRTQWLQRTFKWTSISPNRTKLSKISVLLLVNINDYGI
jgi:hypothetical protein